MTQFTDAANKDKSPWSRCYRRLHSNANWCPVEAQWYAHSCSIYSWTTSQMPSKRWRRSLRMMPQWLLAWRRTYAFTGLLLPKRDWSKKLGLPINHVKCNYLTIGREEPLGLSFFLNGSWMAPPSLCANWLKVWGWVSQYIDKALIPRSFTIVFHSIIWDTCVPTCRIWYPVSKLVKGLGVQTDNTFSPSAQCTEAANKAGRLIFMIRRSFQKSLEIGFHPFIRGLSASAPRMWYASLFPKPRGRYQQFRAISKIGYWLPFKEWLQWRHVRHSRRMLYIESFTFNPPPPPPNSIRLFELSSFCLLFPLYAIIKPLHIS